MNKDIEYYCSNCEERMPFIFLETHTFPTLDPDIYHYYRCDWCRTIIYLDNNQLKEIKHEN